MKVKYYFLSAIICFFIQCKQSNETENRLNRLDKLELNILIPERVYIGEEARVNIFIDASYKYKLNNAFINCDGAENRNFNVNNKSIENCGKLYMEGDTIKIFLKPNQLGNYNFETITLLLSDQNSNYFVKDTSFSLNVIPK